MAYFECHVTNQHEEGGIGDPENIDVFAAAGLPPPTTFYFSAALGYFTGLPVDAVVLRTSSW